MPSEKKLPWNTILLVGGSCLLVIGMIAVGLKFPQLTATISQTEIPTGIPGLSQTLETHKLHPLIELLKLVFAACLAIVVTYLNRRFHGDKPLGKSLEQAQILLCVAGAMMMIIIGNSIARALGIAGVAGIVRFRTPVEDPRDTVILFLLLALGMATGLGAFAVAGLGMVFLCLFLMVLHRFGETLPRPLMLNVETELPEFPTAFVQSIFMQRKIRCEPREVGEGEAKFFVLLPNTVNIERLNDELLNHPAKMLTSVSWSEPPKRGKRQEE